MSSDCKSNPDFCNYNRVHMVYCDGNSFSGNRDDPVNVNGKPLYFRGFSHSNLDLEIRHFISEVSAILIL